MRSSTSRSPTCAPNGSRPSQRPVCRRLRKRAARSFGTSTDFSNWLPGPGSLSDGRQPRVLTVVDMYTRECVALEGATHFRGEDVARVLSRAIAERGRPAAIQCDNGTEFTSRVFDQWAWTTGVQLLFSRPGKPTDNATSEAFNASVRRECFSEHYFSTLAEAAVVLTAYRGEYNKIRPHSSLGQQTPAAFRAGLEIKAEGAEGPKRVA